ncbi:substrate-binding domain-containing protein [Lutimaribacter sp. EGI FJ00015]|uniref:Substrate-binding domain-containing protein n=1 Tax=Lutimaribacter degradans TaxID=2945989 RepID=A0ACC6A149_9RHOB|nr:substrate-binding domain-containing protein [Lutimaribacter sp. EGI FJ00013]MCM2563339.1 substrate-binding domain-containing protein [Lutimaribacter sp. EGI FJ00013]MCO0614583.1 substrate-binding domain-containing protein [Lutimaribacter sp. EGI FJ00015]MCO0637255.1 substrate-binding domain-containing protein [Lutimaribacter sp. EGI FJ00014]
MSFTKLSVSALALAAVSATAAAARDEIRIVGSSTVFPYTQAVAEQFANNTGAPSPIVESTGTGGGMKIFCGGIGEQHPDITGASRAMKASEYQLCQENGVTEVSEALIGFDGLSLAISRSNDFAWDLTLTEIYLALGAQVPVDGEWADNPYTTWDQINPDLPAVEILAYGPPPTSGTRDAFVELAMHAGCEELDYVKDGGFDGDWVKENCSRMRTDGPFVEAGENDNLIVQRLEADSNAMGIFGYSFLYENLDNLKGVMINGVEPSTDTIADKSYPVSRPLYFYVKNAHRGVIPNLNEFIEEYMSDDALEAGGYLSERGLVALADDRRAALQDAVLNGEPMSAPE